MSKCDLKGCGILLTRAAHQAENLARMIGDCDGRAVLLPAIEIWPAQDPQAATALLQDKWHWIIFVSPNAVRFASKLLPASAWQGEGIGAVGATTAQLLQQSGITVDLLPTQGYDSEGLLSLPELSQLSGKRVLIVRGEGGRPLLGESLEARGAKVRYAEVYRRARPSTPVDSLLRCWDKEVQLVTATSNEVLNNLVAMLGDRGWPLLSKTPLIVISERMLEAAERLGFNSIIRAPGADDQSLIVAICGWVENYY